MIPQADPRLLSSFRSFSQVAAITVILMGCLVLLGWMLDITVLTSLRPGLAAMNPTTAMLFILSGLSLWTMQEGADRHRLYPFIRKALAFTMAIGGLLRLGEYWLGLDLGIDQLLFENPSRVSPLTALNFLLIGLAMLFMDVETRQGRRPAQLLTLLVALFSFVILLSYLYSPLWHGRVVSYTQMALPTSLVFIVLCIGLFLACPNCYLMAIVTDQTAGGMVARRLLPAAIVVPPTLAYLRAVGEWAGFYDTPFGLTLFATSNIVVFMVIIYWTARSIAERDYERIRAEERIRYLAHYDNLTNLPNRTLLLDRLKDAIVNGQRENRSVAFLLMDIDRFKEINDTLGHHWGDVLLQQIGSRLQGALYEKDMVARLGGDEFAVVLPLAESPHALRVADKIMKALEPSFLIEGLPIAVEVSMGISLYPDHGTNAETLMQRADIAMYAAKQTGRGYLIYAPDLDQHSPRRLALMGELRQAIEQDQLFLHYQPKISLKTGRVIGVEALMRWQHPEHGMIPPDQFIGPAERTGLIKPLTEWLLNVMQHQCLAWHQSGIEITTAVNLSVRNLLDPRLPDRLQELIQKCDRIPNPVELEITETAIMVDPARAMEIITHLRAMGFRLVIDDFGAGYSSLVYLQKLPVDTIKIDKSFVIGMMANESDAAIVRSTIDLSHNLSLKVVAEGVENKETLDRLVTLGCDAAQGYYICRPLPADELTRWLHESPYGLATLS